MEALRKVFDKLQNLKFEEEYWVSFLISGSSAASVEPNSIRNLTKLCCEKLPEILTAIYRGYRNKALPLKTWGELGLSKMKKEVSELEKELSDIK
jgi:hypothetical protein